MTFRELIYPNKCVVCRKIIAHGKYEYICECCEKGILDHNICPKCGKPYSLDGEMCIYCDEVPKGITSIRGLFPYTQSYKDSILRWKYRGLRKYGRAFATLFNESILSKKIPEIDAIIPVPIAPNRYRKRGFNQAEDFAREISALISIPVYNVLIRTCNTKPQSACTKSERKQNIKGTIALKSKTSIGNIKTIVIVDDIYTTGSTIRECINVICDRYTTIETIYVWTVGIAI